MNKTNDKIGELEANEVAFDSATREYLADIDGAMSAEVRKACEPFIRQKETIMIHFLRLQRLSGEWHPKPDWSGVVRSGEPMPIPMLADAPIVRKPRKRR